MSTHKTLAEKAAEIVEELKSLDGVSGINNVEIGTPWCSVRISVFQDHSATTTSTGSDKPAPKKRARKAKAKPVEPVEPTEPVEPVEPVEPIEPTEPVEPVEPVEPIDLDDAFLDEPSSSELKTKYTKDEMLDVLRSTIKSNHENRASVRAFLKDELGANNTDELKVKDYPAIVQKCIDLGYTDE